HLKGSGMVEKARELAATHGWFWPRQFENQANAEVHERHTGPEIAAAFAGRRLDYVVLGTGTGGSLRGIGHALRRLRPDVRLVVAEPDNAPLLSGGRPQPEHGSHPDFRPHPMQGWTPDFIPLHTAAALTEDLVHRVMPVGGDQALATSRDLARREGILAGITSGATVAAGLRLLAEEPAAEVLCLLPDTGERYLSTPLFDDIGQDMDAGEWEISRSSPTARFDAPGRGAAPTVPLPPASSVDESVLRWFEGVVRDPAQPVVAFTLAWCEFSWSLRRLFERIGLPFRVAELDAPPLRAAGLDLQLRALLHIPTGQPTLPQVFVGGRYLGGCTETMAVFRQFLLEAAAELRGVESVIGHSMGGAAGRGPAGAGHAGARPRRWGGAGQRGAAPARCPAQCPPAAHPWPAPWPGADRPQCPGSGRGFPAGAWLLTQLQQYRPITPLCCGSAWAHAGRPVHRKASRP